MSSRTYEQQERATSDAFEEARREADLFASSMASTWTDSGRNLNETKRALLAEISDLREMLPLNEAQIYATTLNEISQEVETAGSVEGLLEPLTRYAEVKIFREYGAKQFLPKKV